MLTIATCVFGRTQTEYLPGDVIFILRQKPQKEFKRSGPKDIVHIGPCVARPTPSRHPIHAISHSRL